MHSIEIASKRLSLLRAVDVGLELEEVDEKVFCEEPEEFVRGGVVVAGEELLEGSLILVTADWSLETCFGTVEKLPL
jgi:hypothetical protein